MRAVLLLAALLAAQGYTHSSNSSDSLDEVRPHIPCLYQQTHIRKTARSILFTCVSVVAEVVLADMKGPKVHKAKSGRLCNSLYVLQAGTARRLLVTGHKKVGNSSGGGRTCMAEDVCINKFCGNGYDHTANKFPYTVTYSKFPTEHETSFVFDVSPASATMRFLVQAAALQKGTIWPSQ